MTPPGTPLRTAAFEVVNRLRQAGHEAFWVGGCVRDLLLQRSPRDYDVATSARPAEIEALFHRILPVGRQFGVLVVMWRRHPIQVSTFRSESGYTDGRHPGQVMFADARTDAVRRDFTINGLFYDPIAEVVHDWVEGRRDLESRCIRAIGDPRERFAEDHLRLLRAVRLAAELGFTIEPATLAAIRDLADRICGVSAERIRDELIRLFAPPQAARGLELLLTSSLLPHVLPEVAALEGCEQSPDFHPEGTVLEHVRQMLERLPVDAPRMLPWAVLLHDIAKPVTASRDPDTGRIRFLGHERVGAEMATGLLRRLRFSNRDILQVVTAVRHHMQFKDVPAMRQATLRRLLLRPTFPFELELHRLDCLGSHGQLDIHERLVREARTLAERPALKPPLLTGRDLLALGMAPGPALGRMLATVRELQLEEKLRSREAAIAWVKANRQPGSQRRSGS